LGNSRPNTMAKGEAMTPVPEGIITTTEILQPVPEVVEEVVVEEEVKE
jgi:hypothetical protein